MSDYQLIDFGHGRKLESLGGYTVDRPSPAAEFAEPALSERVWGQADACYQPEHRVWEFRRPWPAGLALDAGPFRLPFRPTPFGHIGCFPEQAAQWTWLAQWVARLQVEHVLTDSPAANCLNLFAHTGGSTLAMASAGATVTHVDSARPSVQAARQAAADSGWGTASIRYLIEDASRFVSREVRRGRRYQAIVLDPPSYGHGPDGKTWRIGRDLWPLLDECLALLEGPGRLLLLTGHGERPDEREIGDYLRRNFPREPAARPLQSSIGRSELKDRNGRSLDAGFFVRVWTD